METWLRDHLIASGAMTESGLTRRAKPRRCNRCNAVVVVGLDADVCAFEVRVDPQPLNAAGELLALLEGRRTLTLHGAASGRMLDPRWPEHIRTAPAGTTPREDALREHRCDTPPLVDAATCTSAFARGDSALPPNSPPPF